MERILLQEALHVRMAEALRELYRHYVRVVAEEHILTNRRHSTRTYVLIVNFGQEMELPCFNLEQPGPSAFLAILTPQLQTPITCRCH